MLVACTANQRAKRFGGDMQLELPAGKKLTTATWKEDNLWYLLRDARRDETSETYVFKEESNLGVVEGSVTFIERK